VAVVVRVVVVFTVSILEIAPSQVGQTLRNLGQKPYLPTYTLRQQQSRINQTWRNISKTLTPNTTL